MENSNKTKARKNAKNLTGKKGTTGGLLSQSFNGILKPGQVAASIFIGTPDMVAETLSGLFSQTVPRV